MINYSKYLFTFITLIASLHASSSSQKNRTWDVLDKNNYNHNSNLDLQNNNVVFRTNNSRNLLENLNQIDSSPNGYGYLSNVVSPISYFNADLYGYEGDDEDLGGLVMSYTKDYSQNGIFGTSFVQSVDLGLGFEEYQIENILQDSKFPSAHFSVRGSDGAPRPIVVADAKNPEWESDRYLPNWSYDYFPLGENTNFHPPAHIFDHCINNGNCFEENESISLIQSQMINFNGEDNFCCISKMFVCVQKTCFCLE